MDREKDYDNDGYGSMWLEQNAKVVRKGSFQLEGKKFYGLVIEKQNQQGDTQYEMYVAMGLLHINKPEEKISDKSPDMGGRVRIPFGKTYKLGIWAKESEKGVPYSSLGFTEVDDVNEDQESEPVKPVEDGSPKF